MPTLATDPLTIPAADEQTFPHWRHTSMTANYVEHPHLNIQIVSQRCRYDGEGGCVDAPVSPIAWHIDDVFTMAETYPAVMLAFESMLAAIEAEGVRRGVL